MREESMDVSRSIGSFEQDVDESNRGSTFRYTSAIGTIRSSVIYLHKIWL